jgi:serine/threonine protein kinase
MTGETIPPPPMSALPAGTQLEEYVIRSVVGEGGFGIVYLAQDTLLDRDVAIKEYLPGALAGRNAGSTLVSVRTSSNQDQFARGLKRFVNEAHILARFRHPGLVAVLRFIEANGTAYMVMPYYRGKTLREMVQAGYRVKTTEELFSVLLPVLEGLAQIHSVSCYHLDISSDNIIILENGAPVLLDFGAARHTLGTNTPSSTIILKPGFAPIEQYTQVDGLELGPWTDIYAVSTVAYLIVTGTMPTISVARAVRDPVTPLSNFAQPGLSADVLKVLEVGMAIEPGNRPQTVGAFADALKKANQGQQAQTASGRHAAQPSRDLVAEAANLGAGAAKSLRNLRDKSASSLESGMSAARSGASSFMHLVSSGASAARRGLSSAFNVILDKVSANVGKIQAALPWGLLLVVCAGMLVFIFSSGKMQNTAPEEEPPQQVTPRPVIPRRPPQPVAQQPVAPLPVAPLPVTPPPVAPPLVTPSPAAPQPLTPQPVIAPEPVVPVVVSSTGTSSTGTPSTGTPSPQAPRGNRPPTAFGGVVTQSATVDSNFVWQLPRNLFSDPDGDRLTFRLIQINDRALPGWLTFNSSSGVLSGTPGNSDQGTHGLKVIATDSKGASTSVVFYVAVNPRPVRPTAGTRLEVSVRPWGDIYMDGKKIGTAPPVFVLNNLTEGMHRIEIRNGSNVPHIQNVNVMRGRVTSLSHNFVGGGPGR